MAVLGKHIDLVRLVAGLLAGTFLSACMTWQTQTLQPERFRTADSTRSVRLILASGDTLVVGSPVIVDDSLVGMRSRAGVAPDSLERVSIPLASVSEVQVEKANRAIAGVLGFALAVAIYAATNPCWAFCSGR